MKRYFPWLLSLLPWRERHVPQDANTQVYVLWREELLRAARFLGAAAIVSALIQAAVIAPLAEQWFDATRTVEAAKRKVLEAEEAVQAARWKLNNTESNLDLVAAKKRVSDAELALSALRMKLQEAERIRNEVPWQWPVGYTSFVTLLWFYLWRRKVVEYKLLNATMMNHEELRDASFAQGLPPFWADQRICFYVFAGYIQLVLVVLPAALGNSGERHWNEVLSIAGLLVWPLTVILGVVIAVNGLKKMIPEHDNNMKERDSLGSRILTLEVRADQAKLPEPNGSADFVAGPVSSKTYQALSKLSPQATVFLAWQEVEIALRKVALHSHLDHSDQLMIRNIIETVKEKGLITEEIDAILTELRSVRNRAIHSTRLKMMPYEAEEYIRLSHRVIAHLEQIAKPK